jgi:uncharacterized protein (TIGR02145 family)
MKANRFILVASMVLAMIFTFSCSSDENNNSDTNKYCIDVENNNSQTNKCTGFVYGTERLHYGKNKPQFCDERDGEKYVYTVIGNQIWMAENLKYNSNCSVCYNYDDKCDTYGKLYSGTTALIVCPKGWHLPNDAEWDQLYRYADNTSGTESAYDSETAGKYLKAESGWNGWIEETGNGEDKFGFAALPGGLGLDYGNYGSPNLAGYYYFLHAGNFGFWASATEHNEYRVSIRRIFNHSSYAVSEIGQRTDLYSVRCIKD